MSDVNAPCDVADRRSTRLLLSMSSAKLLIAPKSRDFNAFQNFSYGKAHTPSVLPNFPPLSLTGIIL